MANLEFIDYSPMREVIANGAIRWEPDRLSRPIQKLPQVFWENGEPWSEANHWALSKAKGTIGANLKTVTTQLKHLAAYATWLETGSLDWRHFPMRKDERAIVRFRGELIRQRDELGTLRPSTTTARMAAVLQFYRFANIYGFVDRTSPMWVDKQVIHRFFDSAGFARSMLVTSSDLAIPNRRRPGITLEDGLTPLRPEHASELLDFTAKCGLIELHYMLSLGILSGARLETIMTLEVRHIEGALADEDMPGFSRISVGPGTGVQTKFDISGELLIPTFLVKVLKGYAYSMQRLRRQALASQANRGRLFLTVRGNPYMHQTMTRLMTELRRRSLANGIRFMQSFKFHQTRATYGTMLMELTLDVTTVSNAVAFVRDAMLHKDEVTTLRYVRFVQNTPVKALISKEFSSLFCGVVNRDWNKYRA